MGIWGGLQKITSVGDNSAAEIPGFDFQEALLNTFCILDSYTAFRLASGRGDSGTHAETPDKCWVLSDSYSPSHLQPPFSRLCHSLL